jgi:hypothetical protein
MMNFPLFSSLGHDMLNMESTSPAFDTPHWTSVGRVSAERPEKESGMVSFLPKPEESFRIQVGPSNFNIQSYSEA